MDQFGRLGLESQRQIVASGIASMSVARSVASSATPTVFTPNSNPPAWRNGQRAALEWYHPLCAQVRFRVYAMYLRLSPGQKSDRYGNLRCRVE